MGSRLTILPAFFLVAQLAAPAISFGQDHQAILPKAVGEARSVRVSPAFGAATESIALEVSPGRRNVQPRLALEYSSMGPLGAAGLGWTLSTGRVERWRGDGTPTVGDPDTFYYSLSGAGGELRNTGGGAYRARIESVYREFHRSGDGWAMSNGEGVLHRFGGTPESRIDGELWLLDLVTDPMGNTIRYYYAKTEGVLYLQEIRYTGFAPTGDSGANQVLVEYEPRPDVRISHEHAVRQVRDLRIRRISMLASGSLVRRYELHYQPSPLNGQSLLSRVVLVGADDVARITLRTLSYGTRLPGWHGDRLVGNLPLDLADADGRDTGVRVVDVDGDAYADVIGNDGAVYLNDKLGGFALDTAWTAALQAVGVAFVDGDGADAGVRTLDVNGDLLRDLVIATPRRTEVWLNTGVGWALDAQWTASLASLGSEAVALTDPSFQDFPTDCSPPHCDGPLGQFPDCTPSHCDEAPGDAPDCVPQHCSIDPDPGCYPDHCGTSLDCGSDPFGCVPLIETFSLVDGDGDWKGVLLTDVNGDGLVDVVWSMSRSDALFWMLSRQPAFIRGVFLNTGSGWVRDDTLTQALWTFDFVTDSEVQGYDLLDVNGDGIVDIVRTLASARAVYLGNGSEWLLDQGYTDSLNANQITSLDDDRVGQGLVPTDFDDDGLVDYVRATGLISVKPPWLPAAYRNTGTGWEFSHPMREALAGSGAVFVWINSDGAAESGGSVLADVNGDGLSDVVSARQGWGNRLDLSSGLRDGLLVHSTSALGEETQISWTVSPAFDNQRSDGAEGLPMVLPVVALVTRRDGRGTEHVTHYDYRGGLLGDRMFQGFAWSQRSLPSGLDVQAWHPQEEGLIGLFTLEEGLDLEGRVRTRRSSVYEKVVSTPFVTQVRLVQMDQELIDPGGSMHTRATFVHDDRLNILTVQRDPDVRVEGDESRQSYSWLRNDAVGIWSLPVRSRVLDASGEVASESIYLYDGLPEGQVSLGLPSESKDLVAPGQHVFRRMSYDAYGNVVSVRDRDGEVSTFEYDALSHTYRTRAVDAEGREVRSEYDPRFGELVRDVDASENVAVNEYDAFGRISRVILPGDEDSPFGTRSYGYSALGDATAQFYRVAETEEPGRPDTLETTSFFDGLGLVYRTEREGPEGRTVVQTTEFDDEGNVLTSSRAFFSGETPRLSSVDRDELHRPVRVEEADGIEMTLDYQGQRTELVDRRGIRSLFERDSEGRITAVRQWVDGSEQVTSYRYDVLGNLVGITDALGSETRIYYDALGRRTRLEDPGAGAFEYQYDGEGHVIAQMAPDGDTTLFEYNAAGDLVRKAFSDDTEIELTYGLPGDQNGIGRIVRVRDKAGTVDLRYDARGNVTERRRQLRTRSGKLSGRTYVTGYSYDSLGRIRRLTYPDGFTIHYQYDGGGNLARIIDDLGNEIVGALRHNAEGQLLDLEYGNGVQSSFDYDELSRMTSIRTASKEGEWIQDLRYRYDVAGNVLGIDDLAFGASQGFDYDEVGRLVRAVGAYGEELYEYDAIGNLLRKGDISFVIDAEHPQRVICGVQLGSHSGRAKGIGHNPNADPCGEVATTGAKGGLGASRRSQDVVDNWNVDRSFRVAYDERGNVVRKGGRSFEYGPENELTSAHTANGRMLEWNVYGANGQRVIQGTARGATIFIDGVYQESRTHASRHVRAGRLLVATVITPRATVRLIEGAPPPLLGGQSVWGSGVVSASLVGVVAVGLFGRGGRRRMRVLAGRTLVGAVAVGARARIRPGETLGAVLLVPIYLLAATQPAHALTQPPSAEKRYYYHQNHLGSVQAVTNERGVAIERREYRPYGEGFDWTGPQSGPRELVQSFGGHRYDEVSGLYYLGARHYDAELGRFLTADTQVPDPMDPRSLNRYAFAGGNPIRYADPIGHAWYDIFLDILVFIGLGLLFVFTGGFGGIVAFLAVAGAATFAAISISRGLSPLDQDFWVSVATGFVLGAVVGAGIATLPFSFGATFGLAAGSAALAVAQVAAAILVGAMFGAVEATIVHFANGGGPEALLVGMLEAAGIGAAIGLATFGLGKGISAHLGKAIRGLLPSARVSLMEAVRGTTNAAVRLLRVGPLGKVLASLRLTFNVGRLVHAGATRTLLVESIATGFEGAVGPSLLALLWYSGSPMRTLGVPAWALAGTAFGGRGDPAAADLAGALQTMPLAP